MAQINLPDQLKADLEQLASTSGEFKSADEYAAYVLNQVVAKKKAANTQQEVYSKADEAQIKERLQNLGYLD